MIRHKCEVYKWKLGKLDFSTVGEIPCLEQPRMEFLMYSVLILNHVYEILGRTIKMGNYSCITKIIKSPQI